MNGHLIEKAIGVKAAIRTTAVASPAPSDHWAQIEARIARLLIESRRGLWTLLLFLVVSTMMLAIRDVTLVDTLPEAIRGLWGDPIPPLAVHIVLAVSTLSALIITAGRALNDKAPAGSVGQVALFSCFYLLYWAANAQVFFPVACAGGVVVILANHWHRWASCRRAIKDEQQTLRKLSLWPMAALNDRH